MVQTATIRYTSTWTLLHGQLIANPTIPIQLKGAKPGPPTKDSIVHMRVWQPSKETLSQICYPKQQKLYFYKQIKSPSLTFNCSRLAATTSKLVN